MQITQKFSVDYVYQILFTKNIFSKENHTLLNVLTNEGYTSRKVLFVIDKSVACNHPLIIQDITKYTDAFDTLHLLHEPIVIDGGETVKNDLKYLELLLSFIDSAHLDRQSFLVAIGGGAVLDLAGFAASIGHRGIQHIRIPSTVLAQNDAGIGVKNGINFFNKKNFLGSFAPPQCVINDVALLKTLSDRDWRSGISEAVKVALIKNESFFEWIEDNVSDLNMRLDAPMEILIYKCAKLHADHISKQGDPFERSSKRPLDFGHWAAHKLEQLSSYNLRHGEAVAIGIALDSAYSYFSGYLNYESFDRIICLLLDLGFFLAHSLLMNQNRDGINMELLSGLNEFKEHLGGDLQVPLLTSIGQQIDVGFIDQKLLDKAVMMIFQKNETYR